MLYKYDYTCSDDSFTFQHLPILQLEAVSELSQLYSTTGLFMISIRPRVEIQLRLLPALLVGGIHISTIAPVGTMERLR